jgi:hypothetical protein
MRLGKPLTALTVLSSVAAATTLAFAAQPAPASASATLSPAETAALVHMREEEKLARDVYLALAKKWSLPVFGNIARAEQQHMNAVGALLDRYGIADPAAGKKAGQFTNPEFEKLYADLVSTGNRSLAAALGVGVRIEKLDIADLRERLDDTSAADVRLVFTRLERASQNHLRAFSR